MLILSCLKMFVKADLVVCNNETDSIEQTGKLVYNIVIAHSQIAVLNIDMDVIVVMLMLQQHITQIMMPLCANMELE